MSVVNFDQLRRTWRARRFEYSNTIVKECVDEKKNETAVLDAYCSRDSFIAMKMDSSFTTLIGSRGWYVYQKLTWENPKKDEALSFKKETDLMTLRFDPFSIAFTRTSIEYLTPLMVGHIPLEISKFFYFFLERGGKMEAKIYRTKCEESPIPKGGLEIVTQVTCKTEEEKKRFLLLDSIKENYKTPKSEAHEIIEDKENGTGDKNNSDDEDIMFFIDVKKKRAFNSSVFFLLFCYFN